MKKFLVLMLIVSVFMTGCYINDDVEPHQVGAKLNRNAVVSCVGPGVYTDLGLFADLREVNVTTVTFEVEDPEVATKDNQLVGIKITIQARRKGDCDSTKAFLANWANLLDDNTLIMTIDATAREGIKNGTRSMTLTELLDDRNLLSTAITSPLEEDAAKYNVEIVNVTIENVAIAAEYALVMQETAQLKAQENFEERRQKLIEQKASTDIFERQQAQLVLKEQLIVEQKQTEVDVEIAKRAGAKTAAAQQVYSDNPQAYELRRLEALANVLGENAVIYFIDPSSDLNVFTGTNGQIVPVQ